MSAVQRLAESSRKLPFVCNFLLSYCDLGDILSKDTSVVRPVRSAAITEEMRLNGNAVDDAIRLSPSATAVNFLAGFSDIRPNWSVQARHPSKSATSVANLRLFQAGTRGLRWFAIPILCYWSGVYGLSTLWTIIAGEDPADYAAARIVATAVALGLASGMTLALVALRSRVLSAKILFALALAVLAAALYKLASDWIFYGWTTLPEADGDRAGFLQSLFYWSATFFGWGMCVVAMLYADDLRQAAVHVERLRGDALDARLHALHQQINPHFLFNTLNSLAALVEREDRADALGMIDDLAAFLRVTRDTDPGARISLAEEVDMQRRYLEIEKRRFADRLRFCIVAAPEALRCEVPALLLQPLVENAVKHGMAGHARMTLVEIEANLAGARLVITIRNSCAGPSRPQNTGLGLANVRQRLHLLYDNAAILQAGPPADGGWTARIELPVQAAPA